MSGLVNKVKEVLSPDKHDNAHTAGTTHATNTTHSAAEPRTGNLSHGTMGHDGTYTSSDHYSTGGDTLDRGLDGPATKTDGPHDSNLANKLDPRVDSDGDRSKNLGANPHGTATAGDTSTGHTTTAGPHSSNLANKADPRVDSDLDGSRNLGLASHTTTTGQHSRGPVAGAGIGTGVDAHGAHPTSTFGNTGTAGHTAGHTGQTSTFGNTGIAGHSHTAGHTGQTSAFGNTGITSHTTTAGPHSSNLANKADPRVDSDLDGSHKLGTNTTTSHNDHHGHTTGIATGAAVGAGAGAAHHHAQDTHHAHTDANRGFDGPASKTDGPHSSNVANKLDPRVDSDRDHSKNLGVNPSGSATTGNPSTTTHGTYGTTGTGDAFFTGNTTHGTGMAGTTGTHTGNTTHGTGLGSVTGAHTGTTHGTGLGSATGAHTGTTHGSGLTGATGTHTGTAHGTGLTGTTGTHTQGLPEGTSGPHKSRVANAADPRVDSDRDGSHKLGTDKHSTTTTTGHTGTHAGTTASGIGHTGTTGHTGTHVGTGTADHHSHHTPGPAPNTAGPHKSDLLNKLDPRVDSNLDGSKTIGGDKTYAHS